MSQPSQPIPPKKSRKTLFLAASLVVLAAGGGGAYWTLAAPTDAPATAPSAPPAYVTLDPFVVNLADDGGRRFLRLTIGLVIDGEPNAKAFSADAVERMRVRSAMLELLAQQESTVLVTPEGKAALKDRLIDLLAQHATHLKVSDVLFSEFIVQ